MRYDIVYFQGHGSYINSVPTASSQYASGILYEGDTLTAGFVYNDVDGDAEGVHTYQWYRADDAVGTNEASIGGATSSTYTLTGSDVDKYVSVKITPVAATGASPGVEVQTDWYGPVTEVDYVLVSNCDMYVVFSADLLTNKTKWGVYWEQSNYSETESPAKVVGSSKWSHYIGLSDSGKLTHRASDGSFNISTITENNYKDTNWHTFMVWSDGTDVYFDVDDGDHTSQITAGATTNWTVNKFIGTTNDSTAVADGNFNNLKVWDLSAYGGAWTRVAIQATTPDYYFKFNEGAGNTVNCEYSAVTGTLTNPHGSQWAVKSNTIWTGVVISSDFVYDSRLRPMFQGVYDRYSDKSFFCFMGSNSDPYVVQCDHSAGAHTWGTPQRIEVQLSASAYSYPTIAILPSRKLVLTFSYPFDTKIGFAISDNPADCGSWTVSEVVSYNSCEYPKIMVDRKGTIFIFFKKRSGIGRYDQRWLYYIKSTDEGSTWGSETKLIERDADPYGMDEVYMGSFYREPYQNGVDEKWWMAWIAAAGFLYTGTNTGTSDTVCTDTGAFTGGAIWDSSTRILNVTDTTEGVITSHTDDTATCSGGGMSWSPGDTWGIPYHDVYHSDCFVGYFKPSDGHFYDAADTDLGTTITRTEMEANGTRRIYTSPSPPASKDVGYIQNLAVNSSGDVYVVSNSHYLYSGGSWSTQTPVGLPGSYDFRYIWADGATWYMAVNKFDVYTSADATNWTLSNSGDLINRDTVRNYSLYVIPVEQGHAEAIANVHEQNANDDGDVWGVTAGELQTSDAIILTTNDPTPAQSSTTTVYAYVCDEVAGGGRSRCRSATDSIALAVISGNATPASTPISAVAGVATFTINTPAFTDETVLEATSGALTSCRIHIYTQ